MALFPPGWCQSFPRGGGASKPIRAFASLNASHRIRSSWLALSASGSFSSLGSGYLTARRTLDERRQRALCRYYAAAGAGGLAVAVHTTQFAIRNPKVGLLEPVLALAA